MLDNLPVGGFSVAAVSVVEITKSLQISTINTTRHTLATNVRTNFWDMIKGKYTVFSLRQQRVLDDGRLLLRPQALRPTARPARQQVGHQTPETTSTDPPDTVRSAGTNPQLSQKCWIPKFPFFDS